MKPMNLSGQLGSKALKIVKVLHDAGFVAYFAGGCVRDYLMKVPEPKDIDIATNAKPEEVEELFEKTIPVGKQFGVILVLVGEYQFEVATFRKEGGYQDGRHPTEISFSAPEEDSKRRDFTCNGLFYDPLEEKVIDYVEGVQGIKNKVIKAIGNPAERFEEDKLRLLRAIRFASTLNFEIEKNTWKALCARAREIHQVSAERIRDEIVKILTRPGAKRGFELLSDSGLLKEILPEVEKMKGVEQQPDYHPEGDVFVHTCLLLDKLENPSVTLAMSALLHDVGKPPTFEVRDEGKITFYQHADVGAEMTKKIMKRLRFSNEEIAEVVEAVKNHLKFGDVQVMRSGKLKRFMSRDSFLMELELHRIDCASSHGMLDNHKFLIEKMKELAAEELKPNPFLTGHDVLRVGIPAGPKVKELLEAAYDLQLEGEFASREAALEWLSNQKK